MKILPAFLTEAAPAGAPLISGHPVRTPVLEKGVHHLAKLVQDGYIQWEGSRRDGLLQAIDPRIKVVFLAFFLLLVSMKRTIEPQLCIFGIIVLLVAASRLDMIPFYRRILWPGLLFGVLVPLPSLLNLFNDSRLLLPLIHLHRDHYFWIYRLPATIGITGDGLYGMVMLTLRICNSIALSMLVLHTTSFPDLIKALRLFRVPDSFIMVITLTYKYVFAFTRTVTDMHLAKKSRLLGPMNAAQSRRWAADRIASLFHKSQIRCEEIFKAMVSRGFEHQVPLPSYPKLSERDVRAGILMLLLWACIVAW
jgi:cobalt ECF transporter T component CbiQ